MKLHYHSQLQPDAGPAKPDAGPAKQTVWYQPQ